MDSCPYLCYLTTGGPRVCSNRMLVLHRESVQSEETQVSWSRSRWRSLSVMVQTKSELCQHEERLLSGHSDCSGSCQLSHRC